jgi:hypothetical protein
VSEFEAPLIEPGHVIELPARTRADLKRRIDVAEYFLDQASLKAAMGWGDAAVALIENARAALAGNGRIVVNEKGESRFERTS